MFRPLRAEVILRCDGNARVVSIPRPLLTYLGWLTGDRIVVELLEDRSLHVRLMTPGDVPVRGRGTITYDFNAPTQP